MVPNMFESLKFDCELHIKLALVSLSSVCFVDKRIAMLLKPYNKCAVNSKRNFVTEINIKGTGQT